MKTNDLRIGNLVLNDDGGVCKLFNIHEGYINHKPIPLTEEWLLKFGAINNSRFWLLDKIELGHITTDDYYEFEWQTPLLDWEITPIKYVHTLQNLYWCLCGEELEVKQ